MRPLSDRARVSREKLAYIVDSSAAPLAAISLLSTWVAYEVSTITPHLPGIGVDKSAYAVFADTLPFRFYALLTLCFLPLMIVLKRDFGPMLRAERRSRLTGQVLRPGGMPLCSDRLPSVEPRRGIRPQARRALLPLLAVVIVAVATVWVLGGGPAPWPAESRLSFASWSESVPSFLSAASEMSVDRLRQILFAGSGTTAILYAAFTGFVVAAFQSSGRGTRWGLVLGWLGAAWLTPKLDPAVTGCFAEFFDHGLKGYCSQISSGMGVAAERWGRWVMSSFPSWKPLVGYGLFLFLFLALSAFFGLFLAARLPREESLAETGWVLTPVEVVRSATSSVRALLFAVLVLCLAWMTAGACRALGTDSYLAARIGDQVPCWSLPILLFLVAGAISFATGSSWSTMGILLPIVVGLADRLGGALPPESVLTGERLLILSIAAVLEGAIFGNHCSPVSDTTVMASISTACDHIDHARTQLPYGVTVMLVALLCGTIPQAFGLCAPSTSLAIGIVATAALLVFLGRNPAAAAQPSLDADPMTSELPFLPASDRRAGDLREKVTDTVEDFKELPDTESTPPWLRS